MNSAINLLIFANGKIIKDSDDVSYDSGQIKRVKLGLKSYYAELMKVISLTMRIDVPIRKLDASH